MQYLVRVTGSRKGNDNVGELEDRVLRTNPVLEAFGNAKTLRNDNSSRFGKYIQIEFDKQQGTIGGATIRKFLLEKVRIVRQNKEERNFHIFYEIFHIDHELKDQLNIGPNAKPSDFHYLNQSGVDVVDSIDDKRDFNEAVEAMERMGMDGECRSNIFKLLFGVLHLGNVLFDVDPNDQGERCVPDSEKSMTSMRVVCKLLGFEYSSILSALCERKMSVGNVSVNQTVHQARDNRDALSKALYAALFDWLVARLNTTIAGRTDTGETNTNMPSEFIGLLDIFGFEIFKTNSFEQLCINYANEKLQRHFNQYMLEMEQQIYEEEGISWKRISFSDNEKCLELIDGKPNGKPGIFSTLDDKFRAVGSDANIEFLKQLHKTFGTHRGTKSILGSSGSGSSSGSSGGGGGGGGGNNSDTDKTEKKPSKWSNLRARVRAKQGKGTAFGVKVNMTKDNKNDGLHPFYVRPRLTHGTHFGIKHYAGVVEYDVKGFNLKNIESFGEDIKALCATTTSPFIREVFATAKLVEQLTKGCGGGGGSGGNNSKRNRRASFSLRSKSVSYQFKGQLSSLMETLKTTTPHYIRCVKPNQIKAPNMLVPDECLRQLKHAGMMEVVRIRQQGFATREDHAVFLARHRAIFPSAKTPQELCNRLQTLFQFGETDFQIGRTK